MPAKKLESHLVRIIENALANGMTITEIALRYVVTTKQVEKVANGEYARTETANVSKKKMDRLYKRQAVRLAVLAATARKRLRQGQPPAEISDRLKPDPKLKDRPPDGRIAEMLTALLTPIEAKKDEAA